MKSRKRTARPLTRAVLETIERRLMLDAVLMPDGTLVVTGTNGADAITVNVQGSATAFPVTVNGQTYTFDPAAVAAVSVSGGGGDDTIELGTTPPVTVSGGAGVDTLTIDDITEPLVALDGVTRGKYTIGADVENLSGHSDIGGEVDGNAADNVLNVSCPEGAEILNGMAGNDRLIGAGFEDQSQFQLYGGDGNDTLVPGGGADFTFSGGAGENTVDYSTGGSSTGDGAYVVLDGSAASGDVLADPSPTGTTTSTALSRTSSAPTTPTSSSARRPTTSSTETAATTRSSAAAGPTRCSAGPATT